MAGSVVKWKDPDDPGFITTVTDGVCQEPIRPKLLEKNAGLQVGMSEFCNNKVHDVRKRRDIKLWLTNRMSLLTVSLCQLLSEPVQELIERELILQC